MAVYRVEQGQWSKLADDLAEVIGWEDGEDLDAAMARHGFTLWDEVDDVYQVFQCAVVPVDGPLTGVRHVFSVISEGELAQDILVADWFPDYLHVVERLEVLVRRHAALMETVEKQSRPRGML